MPAHVQRAAGVMRISDCGLRIRLRIRKRARLRIHARVRLRIRTITKRRFVALCSPAIPIAWRSGASLDRRTSCWHRARARRWLQRAASAMASFSSPSTSAAIHDPIRNPQSTIRNSTHGPPGQPRRTRVAHPDHLGTGAPRTTSRAARCARRSSIATTPWCSRSARLPPIRKSPRGCWPTRGSHAVRRADDIQLLRRLRFAGHAGRHRRRWSAHRRLRRAVTRRGAHRTRAHAGHRSRSLERDAPVVARGSQRTPCARSSTTRTAASRRR